MDGLGKAVAFARAKGRLLRVPYRYTTQAGPKPLKSLLARAA